MKKILFVTTGLAYGGAETQLKHVAIRLKRRGWEISIASMLPPNAYVEELEGMGIKVYNLRMRRKIPDPRALLRLRSIIRFERPYIVHAHMIHANLLARVARLLAPIPVLISSARNVIEGGRLREIAYRLTDFLTDTTTQVCRAGLERYVHVKAVPAHKIRYVPNGVDTTQFRPDTQRRIATREELGIDDAFVWLIVGRLEPVKAHLTLLEAFEQVCSCYPECMLLIVGQGPLREAIEAKVIQLGLEKQVRLLGVRRDIPDLMNASDAFVLSSLWEGAANVLLEAAASGLPVVATDVGGNGEIVRDCINGFLVPPQSVSYLADAMIRLIQLPEKERLAMGEAGRAHIVANFDLERVVDQWEALYQELWNQKQGQRR